MEPVRVHYIPATTRAVLARLGVPLSLKFDGRLVELSAQETPGEIEWRVDLLRLLIRRTLFQLAAWPTDSRIPNLLKLERELVVETGLHEMEARTVAEGALTLLGDLCDEEVDSLANGSALLHAHIETDWSNLVARYVEIFRLRDREESGAATSETGSAPTGLEV